MLKNLKYVFSKCRASFLGGIEVYCRRKREPAMSASTESGPDEEGDKTSQFRSSVPTASCSHCLPVEDNRDRGEDPSIVRLDLQ